MNDVIPQETSKHALQTMMVKEASAAADVSKGLCVRGYHVYKDIWTPEIE